MTETARRPQNEDCWKCGKPLYGIVPCAMCMSDTTERAQNAERLLAFEQDAHREMSAVAAERTAALLTAEAEITTLTDALTEARAALEAVRRAACKYARDGHNSCQQFSTDKNMWCDTCLKIDSAERNARVTAQSILKDAPKAP